MPVVFSSRDKDYRTWCDFYLFFFCGHDSFAVGDIQDLVKGMSMKHVDGTRAEVDYGNTELPATTTNKTLYADLTPENRIIACVLSGNITNVYYFHVYLLID